MREILVSPKPLLAVIVIQALIIAGLLLWLAPAVAKAEDSASDAAYAVDGLTDTYGPGVKCRS